MELLERVGVALAARYQVQRELGGGMAVVFLAHDLKYDREVALKVLRPELAAEVGPARFLREIQIAARLHHPHILPLYDSDQVGDLVYYVMPWIDGETLWKRLARGGILSELEPKLAGENRLALLSALLFTALDMKDRAFQQLYRAFELREPGLMFLKVAPWLDPLRSDPRYGAGREAGTRLSHPAIMIFRSINVPPMRLRLRGTLALRTRAATRPDSDYSSWGGSTAGATTHGRIEPPMRLLFSPHAAGSPRFPYAMTSVTELRELLAEALRDRYLLERELGQGGMATVYLARDLHRGQSVAIKVMHPEVAAALGAERFLREIAVARSMAHSLIVPLYDSGEANGVLYYVMTYVEGEDLYERLQRERRLALEDALQITHDVASALGYAHNRGALHRDVKPENILLAGGRALVADFGLARAIGPEYTKLTRTGELVGTVDYMSPEQLREDPDVDQRADIYSLGCILYEMLTGGPPYTGSSLKELIARILSAPVPSVQRLHPEVPSAVDAAISRALTKSASARFTTMQEFAAALAPPLLEATPGS